MQKEFHLPSRSATGLVLLTRFGATLELISQDCEDCRAAGSAFFESKIPSPESVHYTKASVKKRNAILFRARQMSWNQQFDSAEDDPYIVEKVIADVLEWGRGMAACPTCDDIFAAASLCREEALIDGIYQRRFSCSKGHLLWVTPENMFGEISDADFDFRPIRRQAPWLPPIP